MAFGSFLVHIAPMGVKNMGKSTQKVHIASNRLAVSAWALSLCML